MLVYLEGIAGSEFFIIRLRTVTKWTNLLCASAYSAGNLVHPSESTTLISGINEPLLEHVIQTGSLLKHKYKQLTVFEKPGQLVPEC